MRLIAGIDEAGYGPLLGPLVVASALFEQEQSPADFMATLTGETASSFSLGGVSVADSKLLYKSRRGLKSLETPVLAFLQLAGQNCSTFQDLLQAVAAPFIDDLESYPWYRDSNFDLPVAAKPDDIAKAKENLQETLQKSNCKFLGFHGVPVYTSRLNGWFKITDNKSITLFEVSDLCLQRLWKNWQGGDREMDVYCDKQGGRNKYFSMLQSSFENQKLRILTEGSTESSYVVESVRNTMQISYLQGAESKHMPVALASMLCKYLRQLHMRLFNEYWLREMPDLKTTEGYWVDGQRFLKDIQNHPERSTTADSSLIRSR